MFRDLATCVILEENLEAVSYVLFYLFFSFWLFARGLFIKISKNDDILTDY